MRPLLSTILFKTRIAFLIAIVSMSSVGIRAQQSSLTINSTNPDQEPAKGYFILTDNTIQDSTWREELVGGSAYFPFYTVGIIDQYQDDNITIYPNPIGSNSDARIEISDTYLLNRITVINALGQTICITETPIDEFGVAVNKGLFFIQFQNKQGEVITKKLVCNTDNLRFKLKTVNTSSKKSTQANSYTLAFEDLAPDDPEFNAHAEQIEIGEEEHKVIVRTLEYSQKNIIIEGVTSPEAEAVVKTNNETLGSLAVETDGSISQQVFQYAFSKTKTLPVSIEISDDNADQIVLEADALHNHIISVDTLLTYNYNLSGTSCSPVGATISVYKNADLIGTDILNDAGEYEIQWTSQTKQMRVDSMVVSMAGYVSEKNETLDLNSGSNTHVFSLDPIIYQYTLIGTECSPIGALVEVYDEGKLLGSDLIDEYGNYSINWTSNQASFVTDSVKCKMFGYHPLFQKDIELNAGNNIRNISLESSKKLISIDGYIYHDTDTNPRSRVTFKLLQDTTIQYSTISAATTSYYSIDNIETYSGDDGRFIVEITQTEESLFPHKPYRDTVWLSSSGRLDFSVEGLELDYVRAYGLIQNQAGTILTGQNIEVIFARDDNPAETYNHFTEGTGGYDFGATIPIYNSPEGYTITIIPEEGKGYMETTHHIDYTATPVDQRHELVCDELPNQKIQGIIRDADALADITGTMQDEAQARLEGVIVAFMTDANNTPYDFTDDVELDRVTTDAQGYYKSNIRFTPLTKIYMIIGGKTGYYSRGGKSIDWRYEVIQPQFAADTLKTVNWTLPRKTGKYGAGADDTITVSAFDIAMMVKTNNIEHAMGRGALFNYEQFIEDDPVVTSEIVNRYINDFTTAFPNANIIRTTNTHRLGTQDILSYHYLNNYYPDSVITHCENGPNVTDYKYTIINGEYQLLFSNVSLSGNQSGFNKETGRALGFAEVSYASFMYDSGGAITNRDKRNAILILNQGQFQYQHDYDSFSYKNLRFNIDD